MQKGGRRAHLTGTGSRDLANEKHLVRAETAQCHTEVRCRVIVTADSAVCLTETLKEHGPEPIESESVHRELAHLRNHHGTLAAHYQAMGQLYIPGENQNHLVTGSQPTVRVHGTGRDGLELTRPSGELI